MSVREYIGARYVPLFVGEWDNGIAYEPLSIVTYQGNSYTSKQAVPVGIDINNGEYWVETGNYNSQIEAYRVEVRSFADAIEANAEGIENLETIIGDGFTSDNTVADAIAAEALARENADIAIGEDIADEALARENADIAIGDDIADEIAARKQIYVNAVSDYGIANDGTTPVASLINAMIADGGNFYFPAGTYLLEDSIKVPSNTKITGEGKDVTIFKMDSSVDAVYHTICTANAYDINARLARNEASNTAPAVSDVCPYYVDEIVLEDFTVNGNWNHRNLSSWNQTWESPAGYLVSREPGTNIEIQRCRYFRIENVKAINGIQHNINVRAGSGSYEMGVDYIALYPSQFGLIANCDTYNQRYDDCITTHDSMDIVISNCYVNLVNNVNGTLARPVSNGIEIDDGSHNIKVVDCFSEYNFCGFQAKGHTDSPPAYNVTFENCTARYCHLGFIVSGTGSEDYDIAYGPHDIFLLDCNAIECYPFDNANSYQEFTYLIYMLGVSNMTVDNFYVEMLKPGKTYPRKAANATYSIRQNNYCNGITFNNCRFNGSVANYTEYGLFQSASNSKNMKFSNVFLPMFSNAGNNLPFVVSLGDPDSAFWIFDGIYYHTTYPISTAVTGTQVVKNNVFAY